MKTTDITKIIEAWELAYADWENGKSTSPSADDLTTIAHGIDPTLPHGEDIANAIYEAQNEGNDLTSVYAIVYGGR